MKNRKITIENGTVHVPDETKMSVVEIANLFYIYYNTAKRHNLFDIYLYINKIVRE